MRTTMDKAGRIVLPKPLRDRVGLTAGDVEVVVSGAALVIEPVGSGEPIEVDGLAMLPAGGVVLADDDLREFRFADQR